MSKLWKRDEADRDIERQRPGAALMMTCDSSTTQEHEDAEFAWRGDRGVRLGEQQAP